MKKLFFISLLFPMILCGCYSTVQIPKAPNITFNQSDYDTLPFQTISHIQNEIKKINLSLNDCYYNCEFYGNKYNKTVKRLWHWDFWTAILGVASQSTAYILSQDGNNTDLSNKISMYSAVAVSISVGIRPFSKVDEFRNNNFIKYNEYDTYIKKTMIDYYEISKRKFSQPQEIIALDSLSFHVQQHCLKIME